MAPVPFKREQRLAFGSAAELYDAVRPSYPSEAVRWLVGEAPRRILELGAGTGIFTRVLEASGHEVVAIEPDAEMRARLLARSPGVQTYHGEAEAIPLPDASVDAVVCAQAHWWFDPERAYGEIARVIRPGGVFGAIWNTPTPATPWPQTSMRSERTSPSRCWAPDSRHSKRCHSRMR